MVVGFKQQQQKRQIKLLPLLFYYLFSSVFLHL